MSASVISADVAIIGGGMVGCATAIALKRCGLSTVVLDRLEPGRQSSGINFGGVRQNGRKLPELPLARRARAVWSRMAKLIGTDGEFRPSGHIYIVHEADAMAEVEAYSRTVAPYGLNIELLTETQVQALCPWLEPAVAGASLCAEDGTANPRLVAAAYVQTAKTLGVTFLRGYARQLEADGSAIRVIAEGLEIRAAFVVNAANTGGKALATQIGDIVRAEIICPNCAVTAPLPFFIEQNVGVWGGDLGLRQVTRGNVVIGGGRTPCDQAQLYPPHPDMMIARGVFADACRHVPALRAAKLLRSWSGLECVTDDSLPVLGFSPRMPNLVHAFGFSEHGFQISPGVGEVVAELITAGRSTTPIDGLSVARFEPSPAERDLAPLG